MATHLGFFQSHVNELATAPRQWMIDIFIAAEKNSNVSCCTAMAQSNRRGALPRGVSFNHGGAIDSLNALIAQRF
ncbi:MULTISPECIES: hypothetical protein [Pandoraea]|uniref:Transposase n=2 Tax=Pandoraea TaxID=93217 RepID=A0ABX9ZII0_9BURK|nr:MULTISPECIES: hypothetical protein [Pandoraea]RRJ32856.1 hypothetical protein EIB05_07690 [Pandoraea apista]RRJ81707.1 hypothetical protein EIL82_01505 [Pandoraea apista]RSC97438.1 hypothetical protein EJB12_25150 [Pandoraea apista]RSD24377.1 hypothetical protein EIZ52_02875 [Pandoraea apista]RSK75635.1 hypothetical protein EJE83_22980 [Pandoraea apista]